ncbi:hypothetical protein [Fulvivirga imtechensis]|nr:hypothetical protein [Fulvivirga imtechensis]
MLKEKYLPEANVSKTETVVVQAPVEVIYPLVETLDFSESKIIYWLFKLRGIPVPESLSLKGLEKIRFVKLEAVPNKEIILGLIGQFWTPAGDLRVFKAEEFTGFNNVDYAKATWSFELTPVNEKVTLLSTETRVLCMKEETRRKFRIYWMLIQPFSSWVRREILHCIRKRAEEGKCA